MKKYFILLFTWFLLPSAVSAGDSAIDKAKDSLKSSATSTLKTDTILTPAQIANQIVNTAVSILGVISVLLIVYGGGMWLTAAGSDDKVKKAKQIITRTVIGVVIVGLAYAITQFILTELLVTSGGS